MSLCPMPSAAQNCYGAPRQTPQTKLQALEAGNSRTEAFNADGSQQVFAQPTSSSVCFAHCERTDTLHGGGPRELRTVL